MFGFGKAAHNIKILNGALGADGIGFVLHLLAERFGASQAEDVRDALALTPTHDFRAGIVTVPAEGDPGCWPRLSDPLDQAAKIASDLDPARRLAGAKNV